MSWLAHTSQIVPGRFSSTDYGGAGALPTGTVRLMRGHYNGTGTAQPDRQISATAYEKAWDMERGGWGVREGGREGGRQGCHDAWL